MLWRTFICICKLPLLNLTIISSVTNSSDQSIKIICHSRPNVYNTQVLTKMHVFKIWAKLGLFLFILSFLQRRNDKWSPKFDHNCKSADGERGIQTRDCRMVGEDKSTELPMVTPPECMLSPNMWCTLYLTKQSTTL